MPTPDMSDEELDELVRRSAEAYPEELPLGNWLRLEDRLHTAATEQLVRRRIWKLFGLEVGLIALLLLLWQSYRAVSPLAAPDQKALNHTLLATATHPEATTESVLPGRPETARRNFSASAGTQSARPASAPKTTAQTSANLGAGSAPPLPTAVGPAPAPVQQRVFFSSPQAAVGFTLKRRLLASVIEKRQYATLGKKAPRQDAMPGSEKLSNSRLVASVARTQSIQEAATAVEPEEMNFQRQLPTRYFALPLALPLFADHDDTLAKIPAVSAAATDSTATRQEAPATRFHRVVVGVVGAPAWSAVRTLGTAQLGGNLGLTLEYRLTRRLRLRSGLVRSIKRYGAASTDYTPLPAWNWRPGSYEVDANCRITEIPLDLRYDVVSRPTYTVFAGVGLTSLLMRNERYAYDYKVSGQTHTVAATVVNGSNYAFGLLTISTGMERTLGSRWSVQAEPFLQLPLGSIGAGKVRLSSAGASFSFKYGLLR